MLAAREFGLALTLWLPTLGCSLIPDYETPSPAVPTGWRQPAATAAAPEPTTDWWRAFGNQELLALLADAQRNNTDVGAAASRVTQAAAQTRVAGAGLYPAVDVSGSASQSDGVTGSAGGRESYSASLDASYEVDLWGRNRAGVTAARAQEAAAVFDRDTVALTLSADVATTYFQYLALNDRLAIARRNLESAQRILELVEARQRLGATSGLEVTQQRSAVASLQATLPGLAQQRDQTLNALALLLGGAPQSVAVANRSLGTVALPAIDPGLPAQLLARRPDIRRAEAQLVAANADIGAARAAFFPAIRLTGQGGLSSAELASLFDPGGALYTVAAALSAPVFQGGRLSAELDGTRARFEEQTQAYRGAVIAAFRDVEDALAAARYLAEVEAAQRVEMEQAREASRIAELQFRAGAVDFQSVLETQRSEYQAEDRLVQTRLARLNAAVGLFRSLGGGWGSGAAERAASTSA